MAPESSAGRVGRAPGEGTLATLPLVRLLQLASPSLPIGAYSYSQGLEWIVEAGTVRDAASAQAWIGDLLDGVVARGEAAMAWRLLCAAGKDWQSFAHWNAWFRASRETAELRAETEQTGSSQRSRWPRAASPCRRNRRSQLMSSPGSRIRCSRR
jgi:urease accessory protein